MIFLSLNIRTAGIFESACHANADFKNKEKPGDFLMIRYIIRQHTDGAFAG